MRQASRARLRSVSRGLWSGEEDSHLRAAAYQAAALAAELPPVIGGLSRIRTAVTDLKGRGPGPG